MQPYFKKNPEKFREKKDLEKTLYLKEFLLRKNLKKCLLSRMWPWKHLFLERAPRKKLISKGSLKANKMTQETTFP